MQRGNHFKGKGGLFLSNPRLLLTDEPFPHQLLIIQAWATQLFKGFNLPFCFLNCT